MLGHQYGELLRLSEASFCFPADAIYSPRTCRAAPGSPGMCSALATFLSFDRHEFPRSACVHGSSVTLDRPTKSRAERPEGRIRAHEKSRCRNGDQDYGNEPSGRGCGRRDQPGDLDLTPLSPVRRHLASGSFRTGIPFGVPAPCSALHIPMYATEKIRLPYAGKAGLQISTCLGGPSPGVPFRVRSVKYGDVGA